MKTGFSGLLTFCLLLLFTQSALASSTTEALVKEAVSEKATTATAAIEELRSRGPAGLDALIEANRIEIKSRMDHPTKTPTAGWLRLAHALDSVSQQRDSYLSQLYWYTDINDAKQAARESGKPILSLRLLGKLTEEFSYANSRFFRTILYSNQEVAAQLRQRFILHWQTVRDVPRITIDFGNGRKLERTVTGNSIHYVLDAAGRPIDGLPGLYSPAAFVEGITRAEQLTKSLAGKDELERDGLLSIYHRRRVDEISVRWFNDTKTIGGTIPRGMSVVKMDNGEALAVAEIAVTKAMTETTILRSMTAAPESLGRITDEAAWNKIARLHAKAELDATTIGLIQRETQKLFASEKSRVTPAARLKNLLDKLTASISLDTVRNEYLLHTRLHAWLAMTHKHATLDSLNEKAYAELFFTPSSDKWFGLLDPETYTAIENAGVR